MLEFLENSSSFSQRKAKKSGMPSVWIGCLLLNLALQSLGLALPPQEEQTTPPIRHEVSVTLKLIQVYVIDQEGKPVTDLAAADFELFDNGRRQTITEFEKHLLQPAGGKSAPPAQPSFVSKMNRKFFLFFDFVFNNVQGLAQAKKAALHLIDTQLQPEDEVGILSYSVYKGLTLHEYLTTSHQKVREVIEGFGSKDILGRAYNVETEYWRALQSVSGDLSLSIPGVASPTDRDGFNPDRLKLQEATIDRMVYELHARNFTSKLRALANGLRYIPGNKYIILLSSGIASSIFQGAPIVFNKDKIESAYRTRLGVSLYNIDSLEPAIWEEKKYENMAKELSESNTLVFSLNTENLSESLQANKAMLGEYALKKISKVSGGKYFADINNYEKILSDIQNLTSSYYVLGYYIEDRWDAKYHKIKIKTNRPGCEVHAQGGYFNPKPFDKYSDLEKSLHLIDLALSDNPLFQDPARFPAISISHPEKSGGTLLLISDIPLKELSGSEKDRVEAITLVFDAQKNIADFKRAEIDLSAVDRKKICHYTLSTLPPGEYECRVVLRNMKTGQAATAKASAVVPALPDARFVLFPPLLLAADTNTYFSGVSKARRQEAAGSPFSLVSLYPIDFNKYAPLIEQLSSEIHTVSTLVKYSAALGLEPELKLVGTLKNQSSGREDILPVSIRSSGEYQTNDKTVRTIFFLIEFRLPQTTRPGAYMLKIAAEEKKTQLKKEFCWEIRID